MNKIRILFFFIVIIILFSCKKQRQHRVQGTLLNEVTGNSHDMAGETIQLLRIKANATFNIFSNPDKIILIAEATTDNEGHFDFGIKELKPGDYRIDYVQGDGKTYYGVSNSFADISVDNKDDDFDEKISIIPTMGGISFSAKPLFTTSSNDTIFVQFVSEKRKMQNPTYYVFGHSTGYELANDPDHNFGGINNTEFMGQIFIKIIKSYNGFRTIINDTVFVGKDERYKYYTPF